MGAQVRDDNENSRLSAVQRNGLTYLLTNVVSVPEAAWINSGMESVRSDVASNETALSRQARQFLTWCITDPESFGGWDGESYVFPFCELGMPKARQQQFAAAVVNANSGSLFVTNSHGTEFTTDEAARLELQTTLVDAAIPFSLTPGASLTVAAESAAEAQIIGTNLFVYTSDPVVLELTSESAGEAASSFAGIHPQADDLAWAQSPGLGHDGKACQVFSHFESTAPLRLTASAQARFSSPPPGPGPAPEPGPDPSPTPDRNPAPTPSPDDASSSADSQDPAAKLAKTGVDGSLPVVGGAALLLTVTGLVLIARRRPVASR